jgi:hypothetical protein
MKRRRVIVGLIVLALVVVVAAVLWPRGPYPCRATFEQVRDGMSYDEVCATVGGPPGSYASGPFGASSHGYTTSRQVKQWTCDDCRLVVVFSTDGRTSFYVFVHAHLVPVDPSPFARIRARLGL